jgi:phage shock protein E
VSVVRPRRVARLVAALGVAASLTLVAAGCAPAPASSSIAVEDGTVILDVRTPAEFASGHLEGAINIDVQGPDFDARVAELELDGAYVVYCRSGNRAATAIDRMTALGFTSLQNGGGLDQAARATGLDIVG